MPEAGRRGNGSYYLTVRVSVWDDEKVLEKVSGGGYTIVSMYLMPLNCTIKWLKY